jgi:predicted DNA-binding mobile mystery protein A
MNSQEHLIIKQIDRKLRQFRPANGESMPSIGWIRAIRTAMGIPRRSLAKKLGISEPTLLGIEKREAQGTISLKTLRETAASMDLVLVYGFVPRDGSLQAYIRKKATEAAKKIVLRTSHTMALEDQAISDKRIEAAIREKTRELESKLPSFLWD